MPSENAIDTPKKPSVDKLIAAVRQDNPEAVKALLEQGVGINRKDKFGATALMTAVENGGNPRLARLLLDKGADTEIKNVSGLTALAMAAAWGIVEVAQVLIDGGADIDAADNNGWTALDWAGNDRGSPRQEKVQMMEIAQMIREAAVEKARVAAVEAQHTAVLAKQQRLRQCAHKLMIKP